MLLATHLKIHRTSSQHLRSFRTDDAYIKDVSGMVNFTEQEYKQVKTSIEQANTYYKSIGNAFQFLDSTEAGKNLKDIIAANMNNNIKQGVIEQDPTKFSVWIQTRECLPLHCLWIEK